MCLGGGSAPPPTPVTATPASAPDANSIPVIKRKGVNEKDKSALAKKRLGKNDYRIKKDSSVSVNSTGSGLNIPTKNKINS